MAKLDDPGASRRRRLLRAGSLSLSVAVLVAATAVSAQLLHSVTASAAAVPHVMVIVEENQEYSSVIGSSNAPYINSLASTHTSATNWFALQHGSTSDYLALISGSTSAPATSQTLVDELTTRGFSWKAYMESMPSPCYKASRAGTYVKIHNPFMYFNSIIHNPTKCNLVVPFSQFSTDFKSGLSDFVWVTPNNCDNMHGDPSCASNTTSKLIKAGDTWLKTNLAPVLSSSWFTTGGVVIVTWDEGTTRKGWNGSNGGHIPTLVIASNHKGAFSAGGDHYGTLKAIEQNFVVTQLGASIGTKDGDLFPAF